MSIKCKIGLHNYKTINTYWKETKRDAPVKAFRQKECCICGNKIDEYKIYQERIIKELFKETCKSLHPYLPVIN
ncbi:MAG: hypothetical protein K9K64_15475 [Desulfohalobiaceae bacterium]|nr:hypothetical protein [Desulfohalobiaceae bacterium]